MQYSSWLLAALSGAFLTSTSLSKAEDWARFRGPNGSGVIQTQGLPGKLDESSTVWQIPIGKGWSSPVIWKDKLFLTAELEGNKRAVLCLDAESGKQIWQYELPFHTHAKHNHNAFASSTPFVDEQRVYVNWTNGEAIEALALDHQGELIWRREKISSYVHEHGSGTSALVVDGVMIVRCEFEGPDNAIIGLDAATGQDKWKLPLESTKNTYSTPTVHKTAAGHEIILANTSNGFMGIDAATGKLNWQHNPGYKQRSVGSFAFDGKRLFGTLGSGGGGKESAMLELDGDGKVSEPIKVKGSLPYVPTPLVVDNKMYLLNDGGIFSCMDFQTGRELYSERLLGAAGNSTKYFSSPVSGDGKIYCCSQTGDVVVVKASDKFEVLGASKLDGPMSATPALAAGRLFIRTDKSLWCFGDKSAARVP